MTPNLTAFTGVDSQNLPDVMVSVQFILAIGVGKLKWKGEEFFADFWKRGMPDGDAKGN
ncbi:hypothetical protein [Lactobacillus delbrueckii]|uniref:hypothetical protein n=1 Tax=Lactobacillus delbrueckii TaxID=1584 RepID=UPI001E5D94DE|nr:hypothetical protein [Lactobacillus delbrueckii]MCD5486907.1 hypothetical protein [Lactobacillus delbrueckii subsp. lactis]